MEIIKVPKNTAQAAQHCHVSKAGHRDTEKPSVPYQAFETSFSHPLPQSLEVTEARVRRAEV